jgi:IclR family acetate operon transcriptional repressor
VAMSAAIAEWLHSDRRLRDATRALSAATAESATAGRLIGDKVLIVARTEPDHPLRAVNRTGELVPPSRSAMGKAILCWLPRDRQLDLLRAEGVADPEGLLDDLAEELAAAREVGYAVDEETLTVGLRCRASAIQDWDGIPVAALAVSGPTARFTAPLADAAVPLLIQEIKTITSGAG